MSSLPTIVDAYQTERANNDTKVISLFKSLFPETPVPYEYIFDLVRFLEETRVNARVLPEVIRGIHNLVIGTGNGQVIVHVHTDKMSNDSSMNVQIREQGDELSVKI
jgi:hypothetical protein